MVITQQLFVIEQQITHLIIALEKLF